MARRSSKARRHPKAHPQGILELTPAGFGFVKTAEGEFFIPASKVRNAFPGDLVEIAPISNGGGEGSSKYGAARGASQGAAASLRHPRARVVKVLMRGSDTLIGRYEVAEPFGVVVPQNPAITHDIFTLRSEAPFVNHGDMVEVRITEFPSRNTAATGKVVRVLGPSDDVDVVIDLIIAQHRFETEFSAAALEQASACVLDVAGAIQDGYRDLRDEFIFTIDPPDARDFDDAVSIARTEQGYTLGVHIADVSRYVPFDSSLDLEARRRATSVYLVDRVLPMLPEALSNNLCSLVPAQNRCAVSVEVELSLAGRVLGFEVFPSAIRSKARLSYDQAQVLLESANKGEFDANTLQAALATCDVPAGAVPLELAALPKLAQSIAGLNVVACALFERRRGAGCMDFDRVEAKAKLDEQGKPVDIVYRSKTPATTLIEEAMILANTLVAQWLCAKSLPCVFRVHEAPSEGLLRELYAILQEYPLFNGINKQLFCAGNPHELQKVLEVVQGFPQQELVHSLMLRAMARAIYSTENVGHYGLALDTYCHFTSPIRRYPDLLVHRMLKYGFFGTDAQYTAQKNALSWIANHSSAMERESEAAARTSQVVKIIEYMERFVGQEFDTTISGVSTFGVSVRFETTVTATIPTEVFGEYFSFDPRRHTLTGASTGRVFRLGQPLRVVLKGAYAQERRLEVEPLVQYGRSQPRS